jgi:hypothetical protein
LKQIIIFSQSPTDIQFVLAIITDSKFQGCKFDIIVTAKACLEFLSTIKFDNNVTFYDFTVKSKGRLSTIFNNLCVNRLKLWQLEKQYCTNHHVKEVFFFSNYFDILTVSFYLRNLGKFNFIFLDIFKIRRKVITDIARLPLIKRLKLTFLMLMFVENLQFFYENGKDLVGISSDKLCDSLEAYRFELNNSLYTASLYRPNPLASYKNVLLYDTDYSSLGDDVAAEAFKLLIAVTDILEARGFDIFVKQHPRLGGSGIVNRCKEANVINTEIPSEFIDRSFFKFEIAIASAALKCSSVNVNAISLIKILDKETSTNLKPHIQQMENFENVTLVLNLEQFYAMLS